MILTNDFSNAILQIDTVNNDSSSTDLCLNIQTRILEKSNTRETLDTLVERSKTNTDEDNYKILTNDFSNAALQTDTVNNDIWSTDLCFENIETRVLERSDNQETLNMSVEKSRTNTDEDNYMILTNDFSKSTLQIGTMKNNSSSTDLCVEDTETIILEKSDTQETLNMLVEKSRKNTDGDNSSEYIPSSTSESSIYSDTENDNTKNNRKNVSVNKTNTSSGLDISNLHLSGTKMCDDAEMYVTESSGKQTHSKKNCCYYCKKLQSKIARHLETVHSNEKEVKKFSVLPKGNYERKKIIETLRRNGNFQFNTKKEINNGELIVCRRPNKEWHRTATDFLPCGKCKGFFSKTSLRHHFRRCTGRNSKHNKSITVLGRTIVGRTHELANKILRTIVFPVLRDDDVTRVIRYDRLIILYGNKLCLKYRLQHQHDMIRSRLRLLGRYLIALKTKDKNITDFASLYDPKFYDVAIAAVNSVAGFDEYKNVYKVPSVAFNLGTYIKHVGEILINECIKNHDPMKMELAENFLKLLKQDYGTSVNRTVLETQMQQKRQKKIILPSTEDIRKLDNYLTEKRQEAYNNLTKEYSYKEWLSLLETTLISVQLFNRRRAGETERIQISEFQNYHSIDEETNKDMYKSLSMEARRLAKKYVRFVIRGKLGRTVPVLIHSELLKCINLILDYRSHAKVPRENPYLFGIPSYDKKRYKYLRACNLMRSFSVACGATMSHTLRGTQLRKHIATKCISLNLLEYQVNDLSNHLGHSDKIHKEHYRLPIASRDILQVSKLLEYAQGEEKNNNEDESTDDDDESDVLLKRDSCNDENRSFSSDEYQMNIPLSSKNQNLFKDCEDNLKEKHCKSVGRHSTKDKPIKIKRRSTSPYGPTKRIRWNEEEKNAVTSAFGTYIDSTKLPSLQEINKVIENSPCLKSRTAPQIKTWLHNQRKSRMQNK
ncbi:uncharacterized protein LOC118648017 isoform X2 [Monomorium pharaonis]|nr:uncharacterized protein LOC118648017 isoform X2 [Monomorium pharaonis]